MLFCYLFFFFFLWYTNLCGYYDCMYILFILYLSIYTVFYYLMYSFTHTLFTNKIIEMIVLNEIERQVPPRKSSNK